MVPALLNAYRAAETEKGRESTVLGDSTGWGRMWDDPCLLGPMLGRALGYRGRRQGVLLLEELSSQGTR